jgi:hypothetical protein
MDPMESILRDKRLYEFLEKVDEDFAYEVKSRGCDHCGEVLHRADFERKPRGFQAGPSWDRRHSFCCSRDGCRKRHTPASVRFLGRKVYVGVIVVLVSAMMHGANEHRLKRMQQELSIDRRTLKRWHQWWTRIFVQSFFWKAERGRFVSQMPSAQMPLCLVQAFGAVQIGGLVKLMRFLSPITTQSCTQVLIM